MSKASIRRRLAKLEDQQRFLEWFVWERFHTTLNLEELETVVSGGFPDPIPNRPSRLDTLDRKSLLKLWRENERVFGRRSREELQFYTANGSWPEQRGRLHYSLQAGTVVAEWRPTSG